MFKNTYVNVHNIEMSLERLIQKEKKVLAVMMRHKK